MSIAGLPPTALTGGGRWKQRSIGEAIVLAPFMIVAGDHAKNDMAGDDTDSWYNKFKAAGYKVTPILKGLGEYRGIQELFVEHLKTIEQ